MFQDDSHDQCVSARSVGLTLVCLALALWVAGQVAPPSCPPPRLELSPLDAALDLNRATAIDLTLLPGIGPVLAERIVRYRTEAGQFDGVYELEHVRGVGRRTVERIRPWLLVKRNGARPQRRFARSLR